jgi:hypothetical protein
MVNLAIRPTTVNRASVGFSGRMLAPPFERCSLPLLLHEDRRALQTLPSIEAWWHDLRYALRMLWKDRGFAVVSIATLGLGIGAATAIFSVIYNVLLAPFPEKGAERMVFARIQNVQQG